MEWWVENVVWPYMNFLGSWYWLAVVVSLVISSLSVAYACRYENFHKVEDYWWPVFCITLASLLLPMVAIVILSWLPFLAGICLVALGGWAIMIAARNIFKKRGS